MKIIKLMILLIEIAIIIGLFKNLDKFRKIINPEIIPVVNKIEEQKVSPTPTVEIKKIITPIVVKPKPTVDSEPWGVAKQINEVTWTMKVGEDVKMATSREIFEALNEYRKRNGSQVLNWDERLTNFAVTRAKYLNGIKSVDKHVGFKNFLENEDGFNKLGFTALGENISYGYRLNGVHTIEWMYAGDKPHNDNQLDNKWNYVGIGVDGLATCLIFGTGKF
jgi:uncharacterized protein YkwD